MDYNLPFRKKRNNIGRHRPSYYSGGPNLTLSPHIMSLTQFKPLRSDFLSFIISYCLYEVTQHYNAKKGRKKNKVYIIGAHLGIDLGPLVPKSDTLTNRLRCQVVRVSK